MSQINRRDNTFQISLEGKTPMGHLPPLVRPGSQGSLYNKRSDHQLHSTHTHQSSHAQVYHGATSPRSAIVASSNSNNGSRGATPPFIRAVSLESAATVQRSPRVVSNNTNNNTSSPLPLPSPKNDIDTDMPTNGSEPSLRLHYDLAPSSAAPTPPPPDPITPLIGPQIPSTGGDNVIPPSTLPKTLLGRSSSLGSLLDRSIIKNPLDPRNDTENSLDGIDFGATGNHHSFTFVCTLIH
jgi:hypothetical protein